MAVVTRQTRMETGRRVPERAPEQDAREPQADAREAERAARFIDVLGLEKTFEGDGAPVLALRSLDLVVPEGTFLGVTGQSGSGKSTFLSMLGGLCHPSAGAITVDGIDLYTLGGEKLADRGLTSPFVAMWAPNLIFGAIAIIIFSLVVDLLYAWIDPRIRLT